MEIPNSVRGIDGDYIIKYCQEKGAVKWLKAVSAESHNFIALRSAFINHFDDFTKFRAVKKAEKPLWQRIAEL